MTGDHWETEINAPYAREIGYLVPPKRVKPASPRRAAEFRGRYLRKIFGTRKQRAHRWQLLVKLYGVEQAQRLSRPGAWEPWEGHTQNDTAL